MKKFLLLLSLIPLLFTSCSEDDVVMFGGTYGVVRDAASGDAIRNAAVTLSPGNYTYTTGNDGQFQFSDLEAGSYTLRCVASGYNSNSRQITVYAGENIPCDFQMTKQTSVASITISTNSIEFGTASTEEVFSISNTGNTGTISWNIAKTNAPWLTITPSSGSTAQGKSSTITVRVDRTKVTKDELTYVTVNAAGGSHSIAVSVKYVSDEKPEEEQSIALSTDSIDFGTTSNEEVLTISNTGNAGAVSWNISNTNSPWLTVTPTSGSTAQGKSSTIILSVDRTKVTKDELTHITVNAAGGSYSVTVSVKYVSDEKPEEQSIALSTDSIDFGTTSNEEVLTISNTGNAGTVSWNISNTNAPWLTVAPKSGSTAQGKSSSIILSVDRTKVTKDERTYIVVNAAGGSHSVAVSVKYSSSNDDSGNDNPKGEAVVGFNTDILDFGTTESELTLLVANLEEATADLNWELGKEYPSCLSFSMTSGKLEPGTYNTVTVRLDRSKMSSDIDTTIKIYDLADNYEYYYPVTIKAKKTTTGGNDNGNGNGNEDYSTATIKANGCDGFVFNISSCRRSGDIVVMEYTLTNNNSFMAFWTIGSLYNYATDNLGNSYDYKKMKYSLSTKSVNYSEYMQNAPVAANNSAKGTITIKNVDTSATKISIYLVKGTNIWNDDERKFIYPSTISFENVPIY